MQEKKSNIRTGRLCEEIDPVGTVQDIQIWPHCQMVWNA